jgi:hypothetical protein
MMPCTHHGQRVTEPVTQTPQQISLRILPTCSQALLREGLRLQEQVCPLKANNPTQRVYLLMFSTT